MRRRGGRVAAALLLLLAALLPRVPLRSQLAADFPHRTPHALAHFLADFSNYPLLYPDIEWWSVEEETGNYTWWSYSVAYACGARCAGRASVHHEAGHGVPQHGAARAHRLRVADARCTHLPLLPWPRFCEETEIETLIVERAGGGTHLEETARGTCGLLDALTARCGLSSRRLAHLRALRRAL